MSGLLFLLQVPRRTWPEANPEQLGWLLCSCTELGHGGGCSLPPPNPDVPGCPSAQHPAPGTVYCETWPCCGGTGAGPGIASLPQCLAAGRAAVCPHGTLPRHVPMGTPWRQGGARASRGLVTAADLDSFSVGCQFRKVFLKCINLLRVLMCMN